MKEFIRFFCCIPRHEPSEEEVRDLHEKPIGPIVKGFIFVMEPVHCKQLDIDAYLSGKNDEMIRNKATDPGSMLRFRYKYYESLEGLVKEISQPNHHPRLEGCSYILYIKFSAEETYAYMREGKFHEAIAFAREFHEVWQEHRSHSHQSFTNRNM